MLKDDELALVRTTLFAGHYHLLLGSGISMDSVNGAGKSLKSAGILAEELSTLKGLATNTPLSRVSMMLDDGEIEKYESKMETNGNYAKIRHDKTYETQYLHMSAFVQGLNVGSKVRQGQVIGFVGQTGLATGPHVCFRFWKNGVQVNHLEENLPSGNKILDSKEKMKFDPIRDSLILKLKEIDGVN